MNNPFLEYLARIKPAVFDLISSRLPVRDPAAHYAAVRDYPARQGKYFRPGLLLLSAEFFGEEPADALLTAAAMQLSEDWLLVHDDVEDGSALRRGAPSLPVLLGPEISINAGDALHVLMWKLVGENARALGPERGWRLFDSFAEMLLTTMEGQFMELDWRRSGKVAVTEREYMDMVSRKSAGYTTVGPMVLGAIAAGTASGRTPRLIRRFAEPFGLAFQIRDDLLSLTRKEAETGKPDLDDIFEGKRTLMLIHLLRHSSRADRGKIAEIYRLPRESRGPAEAALILDRMDRQGSIAYAATKAKELAGRADAEFVLQAGGREREPAGRLIREAIRFSAERNH